MKFARYQHVERLGVDHVDGILDGKVYVFPKIDGTNMQVYLGDDEKVKFGGRQNELTEELDSYQALRFLAKDERYTRFLEKHPDLRLFGEFLVPHHIKSYTRDAWRKLYIFDVMRGDSYLTYEEYVPLLEEFGINYIPLLTTLENPTKEELIAMCDKGMFLQMEGGSPEGIVIKRYDFVSRFKRTTWAKIISSEFKRKSPVSSINNSPEEKILFKYATEAFIEKEYAKLLNEVGAWDKKMLPRFLNSLWHTLIEEEMWNIIRKLKNPTIHFQKLYNGLVNEVRKVKPELFEDEKKGC